MSDQHEQNDYLWDRSGAVDAEVAELEEVLGALRYDRPMPRVEAMPATAEARTVSRSRGLWWLAAAAGVALVGWGWSMRGPARHPSASLPPASAAVVGTVVLPTAASAEEPAPTRLGFSVARVQGAPKCGGKAIAGKTAWVVGEWVETNAASRAQIRVGRLGVIDVEPNTKLRLLETTTRQHRLELAAGRIHAAADLPGRALVVHAPRVTAVDLGGEWVLSVDEGGVSLQVQQGWASLEAHERDGRAGTVSVVSAGASCRSDRSGIPLLPVRRGADEALATALRRVASGDDEAVGDVLTHAAKGDEVTLWHLFSRVSAERRRSVYDALTRIAAGPIDRAAVLGFERAAIDAWGVTLGVLPPPGGPADPAAPEWRPREPWTP